ncbi:HincII family type II restriction endonuclease [Bacillus gobiensis]|uniref:HincII family type II restriction endonuclease n=1 Tax=Bacillus gobiensis TaxID=1441095 RepID=UPI003D1EABCB
MKKKKRTIVLSVSILALLGIFLVVYTAINGNPISDYLMKRETKAYLLEQGYTEKEISNIEATYNLKHNTGRIKGTIAYVIFKDDPEERYLYIQWRETKQIQQHCEYYDEQTKAWEKDYTEKRKHMDKKCTVKN